MNKLNVFFIPVLLLILILIWGWKPTEPANNSFNPDIYIYIYQDKKITGREISWKLRDGRVISTWNSGDALYVFLPSYAHMADLTAFTSDSLIVYLDGCELNQNSDLSRYSIGEAHKMRVWTDMRNSDTRDLYFLRSANIPAMFIDTASGNMDAIHADQEYRESARVTLVDTNGARLYSGVDNTINGHGFSSWLSKKKSYSLKLREPAGLLGMAPAAKWILISNTYDNTSLKNKFVMDMAAQTGLTWTPSCEYIDLYLNGDYAGLYLLSERVENDINRLNLASDNSSRTNFLCKVKIDNHRPERIFLTDYNRSVELVSPKSASESERPRIEQDVQLLENAILSGDERELLYYLDLDSWVRRYLIDEISGNVDADLSSSYFYCVYNSENPVFYGGPVWDYDRTFGNTVDGADYRNMNPRAFVANTASRRKIWPNPWCHALYYYYPAFYNRVCELYQQEFRPVFSESAEYLDNLYLFIQKASYMNKIRWYKPD